VFESQSGYVGIAGAEKAATLEREDGRLVLRVTEIDQGFAPMQPEEFELLQFRGSRNGFTLVRVQLSGSHARLGVGAVRTYSVQLALEDVLYESVEEITGRTWLLYVEDLAKIHHVTGLQQMVNFVEGDRVSLTWFFRAASPLVLRCPDSRIEVCIGQDMRTGGDPISGPSMAFRYSARVIFEEELALFDALAQLNRVRLFFSLLMGRVLAINEVALRLEDADGQHDARVHGLTSTQRSPKPAERIVGFAGPEELAQLLDRFLCRYQEIGEAVHLHMDGLEQQRLPLQLRFQIFIQAIEALHRRTVVAAGDPIDAQAVKEVLRERGIASDVVDRVGGVLAHAHEPGLRKRLRTYWDQFAPEIAVLRPAMEKRTFVGRVVATRNHFAHRTDRDEQVLQGTDLWDHTETVKAISHMALAAEIGASVTGMGTTMLDRRFAEYVIDRI
jgi:hypothetical protein